MLGADDTAKKLRVLVFSKTAGVPARLDPDAGIAAIQALGTQNNFQVDATEDASLFTDAFLAHYDVVVFISTTGDVAQRHPAGGVRALHPVRQAATSGIHAAADTEYGWAWYGQLVGAYFRNHPAGTPTATVVRRGHDGPVHGRSPGRAGARTDEWYNYQSPVNPVVNGGGTDYSPRDTARIHVLLTMDESTYAEDDGNDGVDDDHPISWCQRYDGGRIVVHGHGSHRRPRTREAGILSHIAAGIEIAAGVLAVRGLRRRAAPTPTR